MNDTRFGRECQLRAFLFKNPPHAMSGTEDTLERAIVVFELEFAVSAAMRIAAIAREAAIDWLFFLVKAQEIFCRQAFKVCAETKNGEMVRNDEDMHARILTDKGGGHGSDAIPDLRH